MTQVIEIFPHVRQEHSYSTVNIMGADVLVTQGASACGTMIFAMLNQNNSVPVR